MEGYILQWMDKAWVKGEGKNFHQTLRFDHHSNGALLPKGVTEFSHTLYNVYRIKKKST